MLIEAKPQNAGVYIFHFANNRSHRMVGGKYEWFVKKKREYKEDEVEKWRKRGNFHFTYGKKYDFWKSRGGGQNY